jgi:alkylation response protein AidB-like acyl-CoA dehydrogenase
MVMENGRPRMTPLGPDIIHVCMPVKEVVVHDTWHVSGLCGTGSNDFSATGVYVPGHRTFRLLDPARHRSEPLYRMPPVGLFVYQLVSVSLGIARAALDELAEVAQSKVPSTYTTVLADRPATQVGLARAEADLGGARAFLHEIVGEIWETVRAGRAPTKRQTALGRIAATGAVETAARVARTAGVLAGGGSIYTASPMQRYMRDAEAVSHHFTVAQHTWEEAGRVLLGRETISPVF